jgi:hypothetical protein
MSYETFPGMSEFYGQMQRRVGFILDALQRFQDCYTTDQLRLPGDKRYLLRQLQQIEYQCAETRLEVIAFTSTDATAAPQDRSEP